MAHQQSPQRRPQSKTPPRPRPMSADFLSFPNAASCESQSSMLYSLLPSAVQNRLPRLPSIRRSVSMYGGAGRGKGKSKSVPSSPPKTRPGTPEEMEAYGAMVLREPSEESDVFEKEDPFARARAMDITEQKSGIGWKFAGQGLSLLTLSLDEASNSNSTNSSSETSSSFARQLYIHAVTYILRGLPTGLSAEETLSVRSALPRSLAQPIHIIASSTDSQPALRQPSHPPSLLHRTLASSIIQLFVLVSLLLPYLRIMMRRMHEYERQHHIAERILQGSVGAVDELGKRGVGWGAVVWGAGFGDLVGWVLEEVGGGVREGVESGLIRISGQRDDDPAMPDASSGAGEW